MTPEQIKQSITDHLQSLTTDDAVSFINNIREHIHQLSPFKSEPVDFVRWERADNVVANEWNPNKVGSTKSPEPLACRKRKTGIGNGAGFKYWATNRTLLKWQRNNI